MATVRSPAGVQLPCAPPNLLRVQVYHFYFNSCYCPGSVLPLGEPQRLLKFFVSDEPDIPSSSLSGV